MEVVAGKSQSAGPLRRGDGSVSGVEPSPAQPRAERSASGRSLVGAPRWRPGRRWKGYIRRWLRAGAGASLAAREGGGSLSVFLLLPLHLLYDFPDLALCSLAGEEMPDDFHHNFLVLIGRLVAGDDDFCAR